MIRPGVYSVFGQAIQVYLADLFRDKGVPNTPPNRQLFTQELATWLDSLHPEDLDEDKRNRRQPGQDSRRY